VLAVALAYGVRARWSAASVRAWTALAILIFLAQSLIWTLHSTRGSYFHSLAAFYPFGVAIAVVGAERLLASRTAAVARGWTYGVLLLYVAFSVGALLQWDAVFNGGAKARAAALDAIPAGNFLAIDAAAWRWISGRQVVVTPSDALEVALCAGALSNTHPTSIVLEEPHFRAYDELYRGGRRPAWLGAPVEHGTVKIFPLNPTIDIGCSVAR